MMGKPSRASRWAAGLASAPLLFGASAVLAQGPAQPNRDAVFQTTMADWSRRLQSLSLVTDAMLEAPPPQDWLVWRRTYDSLGYSPLDAINRGTVAGLRAAWTWSLPPGANEITPLEHEGLLFVNSANVVQAFDAASGTLLWQYAHALAPELNNGAAAVAKNMAIYRDKLYVPTPDRHIVALDWRSGAVAWDQEISPGDLEAGWLSGGPLAVKGKIIQGVSGCRRGGCFIVALDAETGREAWRFNTVARPGAPGGDSWNGAPLMERFGGSVWSAGSYDPALNLVYFGTGQTYDTATLLVPRPGAQQVGPNDALYTDSTLALDPETGRLVWHYQHLARDVWDFDWAFERALIDIPVGGVARKLSVTAGKLGIFDAIDRTNGRYLFSRDVGLQTLVSAIDPVTGRKTIDPRFTPAPGDKEICPHSGGGARNWPATAYNPRTRIIYAPLVETCMTFTWAPRGSAETAAGGFDIGYVMKPRPDSDGNFGRVQAINLETGKTVWTNRRRAPQTSAILATGGGLVFEGGRDRMFRALDDLTGKVLWQVRLSAAPSSFPITYSVGGRQYVAVVAGGGNSTEANWRNLTPEINNPLSGTTLTVFALP